MKNKKIPTLIAFLSSILQPCDIWTGLALSGWQGEERFNKASDQGIMLGTYWECHMYSYRFFVDLAESLGVQKWWFYSALPRAQLFLKCGKWKLFFGFIFLLMNSFRFQFFLWYITLSTSRRKPPGEASGAHRLCGSVHTLFHTRISRTKRITMKFCMGFCGYQMMSCTDDSISPPGGGHFRHQGKCIGNRLIGCFFCTYSDFPQKKIWELFFQVQAILSLLNWRHNFSEI